jgi:hypothetical protein
MWARAVEVGVDEHLVVGAVNRVVKQSDATKRPGSVHETEAFWSARMPVLGRNPVGAITRGDVLRALLSYAEAAELIVRSPSQRIGIPEALPRKAEILDAEDIEHLASVLGVNGPMVYKAEGPYSREATCGQVGDRAERVWPLQQPSSLDSQDGNTQTGLAVTGVRQRTARRCRYSPKAMPKPDIVAVSDVRRTTSQSQLRPACQRFAGRRAAAL